MRQDLQSAPSRDVSDRLRLVTSRQNQRVKELRAAFSRGELTPGGSCAIEGIKLIEEALRSGLHLETAFFSESARSLGEKLVSRLDNRTETLILPDPLFNSLVPSDSPQGAAALVKPPVLTAQNVLERAPHGALVVAVGVQDPGNLGTILRSAEAFGAAGVFLSEGTVSPYNWKVLRASAGSIFRLPLARITTAELLPLLRTHSIRLLATSSHQGTPLPRVSLTLPIAIFVGNEGAGLATEIMHQMDETLTIPQQPEVESLNAAIATSIVLYEVSRQKG